MHTVCLGMNLSCVRYAPSALLHVHCSILFYVCGPLLTENIVFAPPAAFAVSTAHICVTWSPYMSAILLELSVHAEYF